MFITEHVQSPELDLYTDAAGSIGYGGYFNGRWFSEQWPTELHTLAGSRMSIALMELFPIITAAVVWGHQWKGKSVCFHCDNQATVAIINKGRSKIPLLTSFLRRLTLTAVSCNFVFSAKHVPGVHNHISDALSRLQMDRFWRLAPEAYPVPTQCPQLQALMFP